MTAHPDRTHSVLSALPPPSRLLLPHVRPTEYRRLPARPPRARSPPVEPQFPASHDTALEWLGLPLSFDVVQAQLEIGGYQMYAVEKWIVERNRPITVLTVYTGDPSHKITVTALAPSSSLSEKDAITQWEQALLHLRRDASARPKQTPDGVLMATSLAYFRSDYTIVHIPHGNFLLAKDQLYTNINLLRMGCGGRSALTLEEPSDSTKERFIATYHVPEITFPCTLPLPLHHHPNPTSSDHLPLSSSQPISASSSLISRDPHPTSPSPKPTLSQTHSHTSPKGSLSKASNNRPSIHVVRPSPTSTIRGEVGHGNVGSLGPSTLALLGTHAKAKTKDLPFFFNATVLELVKLVQVGLMLFGMYGVKEGLACGGGTPPLIDGLLCDVTVRGIERWIAEIGEPRAGLEPAERIAEPTFVSALLSLVLSIRNKLSALGYSNAVPKDPFLHPHIFTSALSSYISSTTTYNSPTSPTNMPSPPPMTSHHATNHLLPISPLTLTVTTAPFAAAAFLNPGSSISHVLSPQSNASATNGNQPLAPAVLTKELVDSIEAAYLKRVASMNENDGASGSLVNPGIGITGVGANVSTTTLGGLRDGGHALGGGSSSGIGVPSRRKVKNVLKGKLEDLTSAVTNDHDDGPGDGMRDDRGGGGGGALSGGEADGNLSVGSSGGQLFRGVGNLLLSGASGITASSGGGTAGVWDVNVGLERFVGSLVEKEGRKLGGRSRRKKGGKASESVDFGRGNLALGLSGLNRSATALPLSIVNGDHGAIVSMLWSGRVADVVALREWEKERERVEILGGVNSAGVVSDGEEARSEGVGGRSTEGEDSDVQMEGRPGGSFGGVWSERMGKKIGSWAGLSKRRGVDAGNISPVGSVGRQGKGSNRFSLVSKSPNSSKKGKERAQSPTLYPVPNSGDMEQDEMLESGQVSPNSDYRPNPFTTLEAPRSQFYGTSRGASAAELGRSGSSNAESRASNAKSRSQSADVLAAPPLGPAFELDSNKAKSYAGFGTKRWGKRPVHQNRLASWSDTRSTWSYDSGINLRSRKRRRPLTRANTMLDRTEEAEEEEESEILDEREVETDIDGWKTIRPLSVRRRSYHDLNSLRSIKVLSPERMRIDVELCAQILIMTRREEHLRNVFACLEALTSTLHTTNSLLRGDYELHKDAILEIDHRGRVVSEIDAQVCNTDQIIQATNTLQYESAQFLIPDLWHTASLSKKKVLELREKVFGAGGRRLPSGKHGAHGRFNRVQWTLDGERRLVDYLGRTESEAEQENRVKVLGVVMRAPPSEDEEENVVEHPSIKPMWLLRFFTSWGARWNGLMVGGSAQAAAQAQGNGQDGTVDRSTAPVESAGEEIARKVD